MPKARVFPKRARYAGATSGISAEAPFEQRTAEVKADAGVTIYVREIHTDPDVNRAVTLLGRTAYFSGQIKANDNKAHLERRAAIDKSQIEAAVQPHFSEGVRHVLVGAMGAYTVELSDRFFGVMDEASLLEPNPLKHPAATQQFRALAGEPFALVAAPKTE